MYSAHFEPSLGLETVKVLINCLKLFPTNDTDNKKKSQTNDTCNRYISTYFLLLQNKQKKIIKTGKDLTFIYKRLNAIYF